MRHSRAALKKVPFFEKEGQKMAEIRQNLRAGFAQSEECALPLRARKSKEM
jgi:hypothetical protein